MNNISIYKLCVNLRGFIYQNVCLEYLMQVEREMPCGLRVACWLLLTRCARFISSQVAHRAFRVRPVCFF